MTTTMVATADGVKKTEEERRGAKDEYRKLREITSFHSGQGQQGAFQRLTQTFESSTSDAEGLFVRSDLGIIIYLVSHVRAWP